tara:strand:+ start:335 stop:643 length:309 start_codon:yes stop_codon:yes gene_type:complete
MVEPIKNKIIFIRFFSRIRIFEIMILFESFDPNNFINIDKDRHGQPLLEILPSREEVAHKLLFVRIIIKVKSLITLYIRHLTKILEYQYQNSSVDIILPPPK